MIVKFRLVLILNRFKKESPFGDTLPKGLATTNKQTKWLKVFLLVHRHACNNTYTSLLMHGHEEEK